MEEEGLVDEVRTRDCRDCVRASRASRQGNDIWGLEPPERPGCVEDMLRTFRKGNIRMWSSGDERGDIRGVRTARESCRSAWRGSMVGYLENGLGYMWGPPGA